MTTYDYVLEKQNYRGLGESEEESQEYAEPYSITSEEFGKIEDYETITITYYSDGVIADDFDDAITNVDELLGIENLKRIECTDAIYIRNDVRKTDYEILYDERESSMT